MPVPSEEVLRKSLSLGQMSDGSLVGPFPHSPWGEPCLMVERGEIRDDWETRTPWTSCGPAEAVEGFPLGRTTQGILGLAIVSFQGGHTFLMRNVEVAAWWLVSRLDKAWQS